MHSPANRPLRYWSLIKSIGITVEMEENERRKIGIFNHLNSLSILTGLIMVITAVLARANMPALAWFGAASPVAFSVFILWLNYEQYHKAARLLYFTLYPIAISMVYLGKVDVGIELFFVFYIVLSIVFLQNAISIFFSFTLSAGCYCISYIPHQDYYFRLQSANYYLYFVNHLAGLGLIFYALYLIKDENLGYQFSLLRKSRQLHHRNVEIERQKHDIGENAALLEKQTRELIELNQLKNKLFSVIAHDLKTPMYAIRNLFSNVQQYKLSAKEIREMIPGIVTEMNYTIGLMENLLHWAKTQMKSSSIQPEVLDLQSMISEVLQLLDLQARNKQIHVESALASPVYCYADREMVSLVLRNLVSNAIKFTPQKGKVSLAVDENASVIEVFVRDTGIGMSNEHIAQVFGDAYHTTKGTDNESGTGLGLRLCNDFLKKNGGTMAVRSVPGEGSVFSFTLPRPREQHEEAAA